MCLNSLLLDKAIPCIEHIIYSLFQYAFFVNPCIYQTHIALLLTTRVSLLQIRVQLRDIHPPSNSPRNPSLMIWTRAPLRRPGTWWQDRLRSGSTRTQPLIVYIKERQVKPDDFFHFIIPDLRPSVLIRRHARGSC